MEPLASFMDIFIRCVEENNIDDLVDFLKDSRKYFQSLTKSERSECLEIYSNINIFKIYLNHKFFSIEQALLKVFKADKGLITFLKNELHRPVSRNNFDKVIKEVFFLIEFIIENFHTPFRRYVLQVKVSIQPYICKIMNILYIVSSSFKVFMIHLFYLGYLSIGTYYALFYIC